MEECNSKKPLLQLKNISKSFPGVKALQNVDINVMPGEIHVLLGENGAGKSTLIKTIVGINVPEEGEIIWNGEPIKHYSIKDAYDMGISVIYQELSDIPCLSAVENMFVGNEKLKGSGIFKRIDWKHAENECREYLKQVGCSFDVRTPVENLGMGQKQLLEVAKCLQRKSKLIIMDEPTSSLSRKEIDHLLELMVSLKKEGISILFITHKLDEGKFVGDVVTVLKDGKKVGETMPIENVTEDQIITMMVGRELSEKYPKRIPKIGEEIFRVENYSNKKVHNASFTLKRGELLGIFGLVGAGRTELMRSIFGKDPIYKGKMYLEGKEIFVANVRDAIKHGIVLITENRKEEGLILIHSVLENATIVQLKTFINKFRSLNHKLRIKRTTELGEEVHLRPMHIYKQAVDFSGGNQQKIVIEKWLMGKSKVYIFDEPTKGVDVGAKTEIYSIMNKLLDGGASIIMVSSEMQEIIGMSDRVITMYEGRITGELEMSSTTQEEIMIFATGGSK